MELTHLLEETIKNAYAHMEAEKFFDNLTEDDILELYTQLDCVYNLLASLDIVCIYSGNKILKDFEIIKDMGDTQYIKAIDSDKSIEIPIQGIINETTKMFRKIK